MFRAGAMVVIAEAEKTKDHRVDWRTVRGLMVDAIYGGRVDNPHDMRVLATYLRLYFNPDVVSTDILLVYFDLTRLVRTLFV